MCVALGRAEVQIWKNRASAQAVFASARFSRHRSRAPAATQPLRAPRSAHVGRHGPQRQSGTHPTARDVRHPRSIPPRVSVRASRVDSVAHRFVPLPRPSSTVASSTLGSLTPNPPPIPSSRAQDEEEDPTEKFNLELETKQLGELQESRNELLSRVSNLKKDLQDWRHKLDDQVKSYRSELGDLRKTLNSEVSALRNEFQDLRATLKQQLEATADIAGDLDEGVDQDADA